MSLTVPVILEIVSYKLSKASFDSARQRDVMLLTGVVVVARLFATGNVVIYGDAIKYHVTSDVRRGVGDVCAVLEFYVA
jgi:hypothetical protein